jgi:hypothetical protein
VEPESIGETLREARRAAGLSLAVMASRTHYSKSALSLIENGKRTATREVISAYERTLGVGGLGDSMDRREFFRAAGLVAGNVVVAADLTASLSANDSGPLASVQTTHGIDLAIATIVDGPTVRSLRRWLDDASPVLRVNAAGILAKIPGQQEAARVAAVLARDAEVRSLYLTAVVSRVCGVDWSTAAGYAARPSTFPQPRLIAERFAREAINERDAGARWCSATMLRTLSPMIGR